MTIEATVAPPVVVLKRSTGIFRGAWDQVKDRLPENPEKSPGMRIAPPQSGQISGSAAKIFLMNRCTLE